MEVNLFFCGDEFLHDGDDFSKSLYKKINGLYEFDSDKKRFEGTFDEIESIKEWCKNGEIENSHGNHLTLETEFALQLQLLDVIHCSCLKPLSTIGEALKDLMIDEYQLVLIERSWIETDKLSLSFEAVDYGTAHNFIEYFFKK